MACILSTETSHSTSAPTIGIFDSGVGGLTVLRAIAEALPSARLIYFGDTARLPYGDKSSSTIIRYSLENAQFLVNHRIDLLVVACNTASSCALEALRECYPLPILGVIEPGARQAVQTTRNGRIGVLGTKRTVGSGAYEKAIKRFIPQAYVVSAACPLLVPLVEEGFVDHFATRLILRDYLAPLKLEGIDTLVLGCTHYPLLRALIAEEMGKDVRIVDSATTCAAEVKALVSEDFSSLNPGECIYYASDDPMKFKEMGERLLDRPMPSVELPLVREWV